MRTWPPVLVWAGIISLLVVLVIFYQKYDVLFPPEQVVQSAPVPATALAPNVPSCTSAENSCSSVRRADGTTERVSVPALFTACFEPDLFWENLSQIGFKTSYGNGPERDFMCTKDEASRGACRVTYDRFGFSPVNGSVIIPKHWFVPSGSLNC